jgi:hypothetical protein
VSRADVATRLTESLDGVADRYDPVPPPFAPSRSPSVVLPGEAAAGGSRRPGRVWLVAAAAAVALVAGVASVVALRDDDPGDDPGDVRTSSDLPSRPVDAPDGALAPTWLPEGMAVWAVQWWHPVQQPQSGGPARDQLFMDAGGTRRIKLEIRHGVFPGGDGSGDTVRGQPATVTDADDPGPDHVGWLEEGDFVTAWATGMGVDEVTTFLDGLQRRSSGDLRGFDPPAGSDLRPAEEVFAPDGGPSRVGLTVVYGRGLPLEAQPDDRLVVETTAAVGEPGLAYVDARFWGTTQPDGTVVVDDDGGRSWFRPDGSRVSVTPEGGITAADAERVADSVAPAAAADLVELRDDAEAWADDAPRVVETSPSSAITVVVVGARDFPVICARFPDDERLRCYGWTPGSGMQGTSVLLTAGFEDDDGRWHTVAIARNFDRLNWRQREPAPAPASAGADLPASEGFVDEWTVSVLAVPEGVDGVAAGVGGEPLFDQRRDWAR